MCVGMNRFPAAGSSCSLSHFQSARVSCRRIGDRNMRIDRLTVKNFRCFEQQEFEFSSQFNLLVGDNGAGKTAVLEAIAVGTGPFFRWLNPRRMRELRFRFRDARIAEIRFDREITFEAQYPIEIRCIGQVNSQPCEWVRTMLEHTADPALTHPSPIGEIAGSLRRQVMSGEPVILPLVAYYGTGRLWAQRKNERKDVLVQTELFPATSRLDGYVNALDSASNDKTLFEWVKTQKLISLDEQQISAGFECVKRAVATCLKSHGWDELDYRVRDDSLIVLKHTQTNSVDPGVTQLPFDYLSDGYRNTIAMVADIARRAFILNPQFGADAARMTPGIVLIDELDLHLHPKWQRTIVSDLKRAFPHVQFFATSHSPFIIQSLEEGELLDLNPDENFPCPDGPYVDESIEDIAEDVMGVPGPRSKRRQEMYEVAKEYYRLLETGKDAKAENIERVKRQLDELSAPYSDDVAYYAFLEMKREMAGLGRDE